MSEYLYLAVGARKSEWELLLLTDPAIRLAVALAGLVFEEMPCTCCHEPMVMEVHALRDADTRGWLKVCLWCVAKAKQIPYPDSNLGRVQ